MRKMNRNIPFSHVHSNIFFFPLPVKNAQPKMGPFLEMRSGEKERRKKKPPTAAVSEKQFL